MEEYNRLDNEQDYHFDWNNDGRNNSNNNQELNVNNSQGQSFGSNNTNQNNFSNYNNQNRIPSTSGLQNNSGLSSGKKENKKPDEDYSFGSSLKNNKNNKPLSDDSSNDKKSDESSKNNESKNNDKSNNSDNKDKTKENSSNNIGDDNKGKGLDIKRRLGNAALGGLKKGANGLNNLGNDGTENPENDEDDTHVGSSIGNAAVSTVTGLPKLIKFIIRFKTAFIVAGIIILAFFIIILFAAAFGGTFSGIKFAGWYCNMYSPTTQENPGEVSSFYGWRIWNNKPDDHKGVDISYQSKGASILATHDGIIVETNYKVDDVSGEPYGVYITIEDPKITDEETKYRTYYAHMCSLEEERKLKKSCEAGEYTGCDDNCKSFENDDGSISYKYFWSCGKSESDFESLINKLHVGATVNKNDVIGYVSDTGYRSGACDFHLHFEGREDNLNDEPDKGFVATSPNRFFILENSTIGCDPVQNSGDNSPDIDEIIRWECEKPVIIKNPDDELIDYCDENEPITPDAYRFKGGINIRRGSVDEDGNYIYEEGLGTYVGEVCGYEAKPTYAGTNAQCAAGVHDYYKSFLPNEDPEAWKKFQSIKGNAIDYWNNNASLGTNGFSTSQEPSAGSIWVSSHSNAKDSNGVPYGHVMTVTKVEGNVVYVYECNGYTSKTCGNYTYTKEELANKKGFKGYINIIEEGEDC